MELPTAVVAIIKQAQLSGLPMFWSAACSNTGTILTLEWSLRRKDSSQWETESGSQGTRDTELGEHMNITYEQQDSGVESLANSTMATNSIMATTSTVATSSTVTTSPSTAISPTMAKTDIVTTNPTVAQNSTMTTNSTLATTNHGNTVRFTVIRNQEKYQMSLCANDFLPQEGICGTLKPVTISGNA